MPLIISNQITKIDFKPNALPSLVLVQNKSYLQLLAELQHPRKLQPSRLKPLLWVG